MTEQAEYFFAALDYRLREGNSIQESLLRAIDDYAHVVLGIKLKSQNDQFLYTCPICKGSGNFF